MIKTCEIRINRYYLRDIFMLRAIFLLLPVMMMSASPAVADTIPSDVFQGAKHLRLTLDEFHKNNFSTSMQSENDTTPRKPRHVYQAAILTLKKINALRYINGKDAIATPKMPDGKITPGNVLGVVELSLKGLEDLYPLYSLSGEIAEPTFEQGKTPTDVYRELKSVQASLDGLGIVTIVPTDVFQQASLLFDEIKIIGKHYSHAKISTKSKVSGAIKPAHAYTAAVELLESLDQFAKRKGIEILGGVTKLQFTPKIINPSKVAAVIATTLADVQAVKKALGIKEISRLKMASGRTPKDVYLKLKDANTIIAGS